MGADLHDLLHSSFLNDHEKRIVQTVTLIIEILKDYDSSASIGIICSVKASEKVSRTLSYGKQLINFLQSSEESEERIALHAESALMVVDVNGHGQRLC